MAVIKQLQPRYFDVAPYVSTGIFQKQMAYRNTISGLLKPPTP